ncbi:hypothetical protein [Brevundimonas sp.]|uniref:hypothetical protein n=1 Tax=Brevundimonas sp. TaxID=1871086 RepID=UPI00289EA62D|nr:hypothetical protein [Brevundimonas sp.]
MAEMAAAAWAFAKAAGAYIAGSFKAVAAGTATMGQVATYVGVSVAGSMALSAVSQALMKPNVGGRAPGEWVADPNAGIPFAFGERIGAGGNIVYKNTYGKDTEFKSIVTVLSGAGPITAYLAFTADREPVNFTGEYATGRYHGEMWMDRRLGDQPDTALNSPVSLSYKLPNWTASHRLSGKASFMWTLKMDSKFSVYPQGEPAPVHVMAGIKGYDHRFDSTMPGGVGPCRINDRSTYRTITNPIIADLNWCLGLRENGKVVGGLGARPEAIDWPAYTTAANIADVNGWKVAAYPRSDEAKAEVRAAFLQAGGAIICRRAGLISCVSRGAPKTPVMTISAADTAGPIELNTAANVLNRLNQITPRYLSEEHGWQLVPASPVTSTVYQAEDRGRLRSDQRDYPFVPNAKQGAELAALDVAHSREGIAGRWPLKAYCRELEPGEVFRVDEPGLLLDGMDLLVLEREIDPETTNVFVTFVSETPGKVAWALGQAANPAPTPALAARPELNPPSGGSWDLVIVPPSPEGISVPIGEVRIDIDNVRAENLIVEIGPTIDGPWRVAKTVSITGGQLRVPLSELTPNETFWIALSYRSGDDGLSIRDIKGPFTAGDLIAGDTTHLNGEPVQDILDKLTDVETLSASNALAVADLDGRVDDTITAAEAAIAAGEAANLAVLKAGEAGDAATASNVAAGIATTKADEAGSHATAANASKLAADASRDDAASSASASVLSAAQADAAAGEAGDWAAASEGSAVQAGAHAADGLAYRNQAVDARDGAVAASLAAGTSASAAQDAEESAQAEAAAAQNAAATAITQASNADAAASSAQISANLAAKSGVQNEWDNADLSQGTKGFTQQWGGPSGAIVIDNWSGSRLTARKAGGGLQEPSMVSMGSVEFGGGPFSAERTSYNMRSWRVAAGERIGIAFDARDESAAAGGAPARWAIVVRIFNNDGSIWGGVPNSDFQSTYGNNQWQRVGRVFTVPVDGYLTVEAYLQSQGTPSTTVVLGARHFVFARMRPDATDIPAYSAPAGGGALSEISSQLAITAAVAANTADQVGSARFNVTGGAGGDPFDVSLEAGPDGSDASFTATKIRLRNLINGQAVDALTVEGGKAKFSGELEVQSGASGERTVITTNAVRVFDAGNVERVTLGRW